jgi:3-oxoacyl-[acyl-carrier protein] reductase
VVVNYASSREGADRVVADITAHGGRALAVQGDVAKTEDVRRLFEETRRAFGDVDVLVNNAGVYQFDPIESVAEREFHPEFDINVLGPLLATREAVKHFGDRDGSVINVSSIASTGPTSSLYAGTKAALDAMSRVLAAELGPRKIRVNTLSPLGSSKPRSSRPCDSTAPTVKQMVAVTPLGRVGRADDIADVALFLGSDAARWVTGERIAASGGLRA